MSIAITIYSDIANINNIYRCIEETVIAKRNHHSFNTALWFLPTLFFVEISYNLLHKYIKNESDISLILVISSYIGIINLQALASVNNIDYTTKKYNIISIICIILSIIIRVDRAYFDQFIIPIMGGTYINVTIYFREIAVAIISIIAYLYIARLIENNIIIRVIGKKSY